MGGKPGGPQFLCAPLCSQLLESQEIFGPVRKSVEPAVSMAGLSAGGNCHSRRRRAACGAYPAIKLITASNHLQPNINNEHWLIRQPCAHSRRVSARLCRGTASGCLKGHALSSEQGSVSLSAKGMWALWRSGKPGGWWFFFTSCSPARGLTESRVSHNRLGQPVQGDSHTQTSEGAGLVWII